MTSLKEGGTTTKNMFAGNDHSAKNKALVEENNALTLKVKELEDRTKKLEAEALEKEKIFNRLDNTTIGELGEKEEEIPQAEDEEVKEPEVETQTGEEDQEETVDEKPDEVEDDEKEEVKPKKSKK